MATMMYITFPIDVSFRTREKDDKLEFYDVECTAMTGENRTFAIEMTTQCVSNGIVNILFVGKIVSNSEGKERNVTICANSLINKQKILDKTAHIHVTLIGATSGIQAMLTHKNTFADTYKEEIAMLKMEVMRYKGIIKALMVSNPNQGVMDSNAQVRHEEWKRSRPVDTYNSVQTLSNVTKVIAMNVGAERNDTTVTKPELKGGYTYTNDKPSNSSTYVRNYTALDTLVEVADSAASDTVVTKPVVPTPTKIKNRKNTMTEFSVSAPKRSCDNVPVMHMPRTDTSNRKLFEPEGCVEKKRKFK